jgi:hypothetical protein
LDINSKVQFKIGEERALLAWDNCPVVLQISLFFVLLDLSSLQVVGMTLGNVFMSAVITEEQILHQCLARLVLSSSTAIEVHVWLGLCLL